MTRNRIESYMSTATIPLPYCPGCGHTNLVQALDAALVKLQPDPSKVVIVTDIGCIGLADRNFETHAFHGLHGRAITYACGLKLARPDLMVIAVMGDGGCGIGGTHLLNVARRNIGITLLVANNFNYGMTGGQHSVTTPLEAQTATTPWGNVESPMDLCGTVAAAGGAWVYRATSFDGDLADVLARAISQSGFAMVDFWELCLAYYVPRNQFHKADLLALLEELGFPHGQIVDRPSPEYSERYWAAVASQGQQRVTGSKKSKIEVAFTNDVQVQTGVLIAGAAGQRIRSAATSFAQAAIASGLWATQKGDYAITVMTGHSIAEIVLGPDEIEYTAIDRPEHVLLLAAEGCARVRGRLAALPETSTVYAEESLEIPPTKARVQRYPFLPTARKVGRQSIGMVALGTLLKARGFFEEEALRQTLKNFQKDKIAATNVAAVDAGLLMVHPVSDTLARRNGV